MIEIFKGKELSKEEVLESLKILIKRCGLDDAKGFLRDLEYTEEQINELLNLLEE